MECSCFAKSKSIDSNGTEKEKQKKENLKEYGIRKNHCPSDRLTIDQILKRQKRSTKLIEYHFRIFFLVVFIYSLTGSLKREKESICFLLFPFFPLSCALSHSWFYFGHSIAFFISFTKGTQIRNPAHSNMSFNCSSPKLKFKQMPFFIHTHTQRRTHTAS